MIITINGKPGSGKTTVAKKLAKKLGYKHFYMGGMRRRMAKEMGMTLEEFNKIGENKFFTDEKVDKFQKRLGKAKDNMVIEGRTSFFFIPHSVKIFLDCSNKTGAERIWRALKKQPRARNEARGLTSYNDVLESTKNRIKSDIYRYKKYYKLDVFNKKHYDLWLTTDKLSKKEEFDKVYNFVKNFKMK